MMKTTLLVFMVGFFTLVPASHFYQPYKTSSEEVCVYYGGNERLYESMKGILDDYAIPLKPVKKLDRNSKNLHIIFDAFFIPIDYFPEHYIVVQTLNFHETPLTKSYLEKLKKAIAVWDPSLENINHYALLLDHYYHFTQDTLDPLLLPCLLPTKALPAYKELLSYSNAKDTDISSHLPALFTHCVLQQPKLVIESGVRSGESSRAFKMALDRHPAKLIGIDIDSASANVYTKLNIEHAEFKIMDDLAFPGWHQASAYRDQKADIIFIDTSHHYDHTVKELAAFVPLLEKNGLLIFHDTNMCPLHQSTYQRINKTYGSGWDNKKGVVRGIKDFFAITFSEDAPTELYFTAHGSSWMLLHYPYCNGLTLIRRLS